MGTTTFSTSLTVSTMTATTITAGLVNTNSLPLDTTMDTIPEELLYKICSLLPQLNDIGALMSVNQRYYNCICNHRPLWGAILQNRFPHYYQPDLTVEDIKTLIDLISKEGSLQGHKERVFSLEVHDDKLFSGSKDYTIKVWDLNDRGKELFSLNFGGWANCFKVQGDSVFFAQNSDIEIWDIKQKKMGSVLKEITSVLKGHEGWVTCMLVDGDRLYSGCDTGQIKSWDLNQRKELHTFFGHAANHYLNCLAIYKGNLISGSSDNTIKGWDVESGKELYTLAIPEPSESGEESVPRSRTVKRIAIHGNTLFAGVPTGAIEVWDLEKKEWLQTLKGHETPQLTWLQDMKVYKDMLITCATDNTIKLWNAKTRKELLTLKCNAHVICVYMHKDILYAGLENGQMPIWDFKRAAPALTTPH